jgi:hypothetical protein
MEQNHFSTNYTIASRFYLTRLRRSKKGNSYTIKLRTNVSKFLQLNENIGHFLRLERCREALNFV